MPRYELLTVAFPYWKLAIEAAATLVMKGNLAEFFSSVEAHRNSLG